MFSPETAPDPPSRLLIDLARGGDESAWREFDGRYRTVLVAFAKRLGVEHGAAEEIAQDALVAFATTFREGNLRP